MFAALTAGFAGAKVLLLEKNDRLGKKLKITGKGRCNVTNNCSVEDVLRHIPRNPRFLHSAMAGFSPEDTMNFFASYGCELKTERGNRVFPQSDQASSIIDTLKTAMDYAGVTVIQARAKRILTEHGRVTGVDTYRGRFSAGRVILATGGLSYPATGSTGDGYAMAKALGHTIVSPRGSLVPMVEAGSWCQKMQGLSLRNVTARLLLEDQLISQEFGELLFTHFGLSGPCVLSLSAHMEPGRQYRMSIDLKPALDEMTLDARLLRDFQQNRNRQFANALSGLYHKTMIPVMVERSGIPADLQVNAITRGQRHQLLMLTKQFTLDIQGLRPVEEAIITAGGVSVAEISPKTMESKLVPGLYFAGEIIDCDGYTGGYNLQIAWATAYAAGNAQGE